MNKRYIDNKGITLISLVVTIIVLIILSGISVNTLIGENGIITKAKEVKTQQEIAQITEELELKKLDMLIKNKGGKVNITDYIAEVQNNDKMTYKVTDVEIVDKDNAYIIVEDKYQYLLEQEDNGNLKITFEGKVKNLPPKIQNWQINSTTNKIEVKVEARRTEKYIFYIKAKEETEYIKKEENTTGEYSFTNLAQNKEYSIKVQVVNKNGQDEREINRITGEMPQLTQAEVKYIKSTANWTKENVTTTIEINTEKDITGCDIQYTKFAEGEEVTSEKLVNANWIKYEEKGIVSTENQIIYSRLYDGINSTSYTSTTIANIDKTDPTISTALNSSGVTTKGFALNIEVTDTSSGLGKIIWNYKLSSATNYTSVEEVYTELNGSVAGEKTAVIKTKAFDNLTSGTYNAYAVVYDVAGNSVQSSTIEEIVTPAGNVVTYYVDTSTSYQEQKDNGQNCLLPTTFTPTKSGWTFVGWREDNTASESVLSSKTMEYDPITLYAVFRQNVTVTYYNASTTASSTTGYKYYNNGNTVNPTFTISQSALSGWTVRGWSTGTAANSSISYSSISNTTISSNITLYGMYQKTVTLSYNGNGATSGSTAAQSGTAYYNSNGNTLNVTFTIGANGFAKTNYAFVNWCLNGTSGTQYAVGATITLSSSATMYANWVQSATAFNYTGGVQTFTVPITGTYKLEVWGAAGSSGVAYDSTYKPSAGGFGGYSYGNVYLTAGQTIYVVVGGAGGSGNYANAGGFNGGGNGVGWGRGAGGGCTHIGTFNSTLAAHGSTSGLYIVAGGGGRRRNDS